VADTGYKETSSFVHHTDLTGAVWNMGVQNPAEDHQTDGVVSTPTASGVKFWPSS